MYKYLCIYNYIHSNINMYFGGWHGNVKDDNTVVTVM